MEKEFDVAKFVDNDFELDVRTDKNNETVWLTQEEMARLFDVDRTRIIRHIGNIYNDEELDRNSTCAENAHMGSLGMQVYKSKLYNLDMIISVGYRVRSKRGITFRRWANRVLKDYLIQGYTVNQKRLDTLNKVIEVQNKMLASSLDIDVCELEDVIKTYTSALDLLDDYDHHTIEKPSGKLVYTDLNMMNAGGLLTL